MTRVNLWIGLLITAHAWGCTTVACKQTIEMNAHFTVEILADGKPVPGAEVRIAGPGGPRVIESEANGKAVIGPLKKGDYSIDIQKSGLVIKSDCFRVSRRANKGRRELKYTWGDYAVSVVRLAGRMPLQPPTEVPKVDPLRVELPPVPPPAVALAAVSQLIAEGLDGQQRIAAVDAQGNFDFGNVPSGPYIMRGTYNHPFLIMVDSKAPWQQLELFADAFDFCGVYLPGVRALTSLP